jgi:hypothetical protein
MGIFHGFARSSQQALALPAGRIFFGCTHRTEILGTIAPDSTTSIPLCGRFFEAASTSDL